ncbi:MAG: hypothetical protein WD793_11845 [Steroidobacteraceae bacterium]
MLFIAAAFAVTWRGRIIAERYAHWMPGQREAVGAPAATKWTGDQPDFHLMLQPTLGA